MTSRAESSATSRMAHHLGRIRREPSAGRQLWHVCTWLAAEARRYQRLEDTTRAVFGLIELLRRQQPLPAELTRIGDLIDQAPVPAPPTRPRRRRTRNTTPPASR